MVSCAAGGPSGLRPDAVLTHDLQGRVLSLNREARQLLGYRQPVLLLPNLRDLLAPDAGDALSAYLLAIQENGGADGIATVLTGSGERRIVEYHSTLQSRRATSPVVRTVARDVTEHHRIKVLLGARAREQAAVARLGQLALAGADLTTLMDEATNLVARSLEIEAATAPELLSGALTVITPGQIHSLDLPGMQTTQRRAPTTEDSGFLQAVAAVLATACLFAEFGKIEALRELDRLRSEFVETSATSCERRSRCSTATLSCCCIVTWSLPRRGR